MTVSNRESWACHNRGNQRRKDFCDQRGDDSSERAPITTATARSMTFPRTRNCLKTFEHG